MSKYYILGQALPAVPAKYPFARTRLYKWFESVGISTDRLLEQATFNSLINYFPGKDVKGTDKAPTQEEILDNIERLRTCLTFN